jgi:hypothetical protein
MFTSSSVVGIEKTLRLVAGVALFPLAFVVPGLWMLVPAGASAALLLTAFAGW